MSLLLLLLLGLILVSVPIFLSIGISTTVAFIVAKLPLFMIPQKMFDGVNSYVLLAVPLFMLAGSIMDQGGISKRLVDFSESLVGHFKGGLAITSILSSMLFAGVSGSAAADTAAVGSVLIPEMKKKGYDKNFAASIIATGGSIGVIIPPSIPMIIFAFIANISVGKLFIAGILPGILIGLSLIALVIFKTKDFQIEEDKRHFSYQKFIKSFKSAIFALGIPIIVVGGILGGLFTATESAAVAVIYSLFVSSVIYKELSLKKLYKAAVYAINTSSIILIIISIATVFSWFLSMNNIQQTLADMFLFFGNNKIVILILINLFLLVMGTFVETTASLILFVPVVAPILNNLGIDPLTYGVMIVTNLAIGMLTPPLGICLMVSGSIAKSKIIDISKAIVPFLVIMIIDLFLITFVPFFTTFLPSIS
ncbi:MAG: TRAP transporter large permease [Epsilonproteobacteria bacterium]|nr:TRAP transporter large permease [Campylobacterota bacterium]